MQPFFRVVIGSEWHPATQQKGLAAAVTEALSWPQGAYLPSSLFLETQMSTFRHEYRELSDSEKENVKAFKDLGEQFLVHVRAANPGREMSLAATKIEEAVMWAVKGITG